MEHSHMRVVYGSPDWKDPDAFGNLHKLSAAKRKVIVHSVMWGIYGAGILFPVGIVLFQNQKMAAS
jgi:hypothetical protein